MIQMTREEAIKVLEAEKKFLFHGSLSDKHYEPAFDMAIESLKAQQWIPCSERLPEGDVLCCDIHKNLMIGYVFVSESSNTGYNAESECEYMYDCIAWMPLPEPYEENKS